MKPVENQYTFIPVGPLGTRRKEASQRALFKRFFPPLKPGGTILEIGPGRGEFARECRRRAFDFVGIEPSEVWAAKLRAEGLRIITEKAPPLPLSSGSVDLVHSSDFIEHLIDYRQVMAFLAESFRVLKPGGYVSVIAPNYETIPMLYYKYEYQHSFVVTRHRVRQMLQDCGFVTLKAKCFLVTHAPGLNWIDRIAAHTCLPVLTSRPVQSFIRALSTDAVLFRFNKNLHDHVALLAQKPPSAAGTD